MIQDLQLKNLLLPAPDAKTLKRFEEAEARAPSARKVLEDRTIYTSLGFLPSKGLPLLSDFGEARYGDEEHDEDIMPNVYRAPEVILRMNWGYKVDIWNVALLVSGSTPLDLGDLLASINFHYKGMGYRFLPYPLRRQEFRGHI